MGDQAKLLNRQVLLQEADMMKFVYVQPQWEVEVMERVSTLSSLPKKLRISFPVLNQGDSPVSVWIVLVFGIPGFSPGAFKFESFEVGIPPKDRRTVITELPITDTWASLYAEEDGLSISIEGKIRHRNIQDKSGPITTFNGRLLCGRTISTSFFEYEPIEMVRVLNWQGEKT
ncbi:MAG: hypothetical protein M3N93_02680 [Acidobacteriota bacterium]|nr:hypothetical protein [Acidobacteriota bacterium]